MRKLFRAIMLFILLPVLQPLTACTMEPSIWKQIEKTGGPGDAGVYALVDALLQFRDKFEKEMRNCGLATGPIRLFRAVRADSAPLSQGDYDNLLAALDVVWPDASSEAFAQLQLPEPEPTGGVASGSYRLQLEISASGHDVIVLNDLNFKLYQLYRMVLREEIRIMTRVSDAAGNPVFIDEFAVSPTILVDPIISPIGGYLIRLEKNSSRPLVMDFGPVTDGGEHVLRFNDAFHQPSAVPPVFNGSAPAIIDCPTCGEH